MKFPIVLMVDLDFLAKKSSDLNIAFNITHRCCAMQTMQLRAFRQPLWHELLPTLWCCGYPSSPLDTQVMDGLDGTWWRIRCLRILRKPFPCKWKEHGNHSSHKLWTSEYMRISSFFPGEHGDLFHCHVSCLKGFQSGEYYVDACLHAATFVVKRTYSQVNTWVK